MYFSIVVAFATLPFLVGAVPASLKSSRAGHPFSIPLTKRSNHLDHRGVIGIEQMHAGLHYSTARFHKALTAYERNTGEPHPLALKRGHSNERRIITSEPLIPDDNGQTNKVAFVVWSAEIAVGTPARAFPVSIDLMTPDMYLDTRSSKCSYFCFSNSSGNFYDISLSSTGKNLSSTVTANYGFGKVTGSVVSDSVSVQGYGVPNQKIVVATRFDYSLNIPNVRRVGVLGLGFIGNSVLNEDSWFSALVASSGPEFGDPKFALVLSESNPEFLIGGTDMSKYVGNLTYCDVNANGFWQITLDSILVNENVAARNKEAVLDSDNPYITGDIQTINTIYNNIPGSTPLRSFNGTGLWSVPCNSNVNITMVFGGTSFNIPPSSYIIPNVKLNPDNKDPTVCVGVFANFDTINMIIGNSFMKNLYTEFDQENRRVGFAPSRVPPRISSPPS